MKTPSHLLPLLALALVTTASAETECERIEAREYEEVQKNPGTNGEIDSTDPEIRPESRLLMSVSFTDGYWDEYDTSHSCFVLVDGTVGITKHRGKRTTCKLKKLSSAKTQLFNDLGKTVASQPVVKGRHGLCDAPLYEIRLREGNVMSALDVIEDCGDRNFRESAQANELLKRLLKVCGATKVYREHRSYAE